MVLVDVLIAIAAFAVVWLAASVRVVKQYERGIVFRFGRVRGAPREPGLKLITPLADRMQKVSTQIVTMPVPAQD
ncbi:MAG: SPFH domain-containing protein, partial [Sciscionella sp.]